MDYQLEGQSLMVEEAMVDSLPVTVEKENGDQDQAGVDYDKRQEK